MKCEYCSRIAATEQELKTHILLKHPEKANPEDYKADVSVGYLDNKVRAEKGEQFGYKK